MDLPISKNESDIEKEIVAKNLNAPRITPADINNSIADIYFHIVPNTTCTICALTLKNGFVVIGHSAAASKENFDRDIGKNIAFENARKEIWPLVGYALKEKLYTQQ
jgi:hypothetical protein